MSRRKAFLKKNWRWLSPLTALLLDFLLLNLSFGAAVLMRAGSLEIYRDYTKPLLFFNGMFFFISLALGLYRSRYNLSLAELRFGYKRLVLFLAISTMAFLYIIKKGQFYSRAIIIITFILFYILLEAAHRLFKKFQERLIRKQLIGYRAVVIGTGGWSFKLFQEISYIFGGFYQIVGYVQEDDGDEEGMHDRLRTSVIGHMGQFDEIVEKYRPDIVFIASGTMETERYRPVYTICRENNIRLKKVSPHVRNILHNSRIRDVSGVSLVTDEWRVNLQKINAYAKRLFDLGFVFVSSPVILPLGLIIAFLVKATSKGPILFKQRRALYRGGPGFDFYKFRSMYRDADDLKEELYDRNEADGALFKMAKDPRVTPFGKIIRKLSLDELPQFINVLKGEMSIVGPRPLPVTDLDKLNGEEAGMSGEWYKQRGQVKPGITGLWQVSGRSDISYEEMLYLDLYYVEHQSVFFDLEILLETVPAVLFGKGAY